MFGRSKEILRGEIAGLKIEIEAWKERGHRLSAHADCMKQEKEHAYELLADANKKILELAGKVILGEKK